MSLEGERSKIIKNLELLNAQVKKQNSFSRMFVAGIVYGVGLFVGSAIIATIIFGFLGPIFGKIPWVRDAFVTGVNLLKQ
jgi:hypothetical protein